jgi:hypothetical protein
MLFNYTYLLQNFDADFFSGKNLLPGEFIIPVNEQIIGSQPGIFRTLLQSQNRFCFCIPESLTQHSKPFIKEEIIQNFVRLLFLPNYIKKNGRHVFFSEQPATEQNSLDVVKDLLHTEFKKQGIKITIMEMSNTSSCAAHKIKEKRIALLHAGLNNYLNNTEDERCFGALLKDFTTPAYVSKKWIIEVTDLNDFTTKNRLLEKFETWIKNTEPLKVQLIEMCNAAMQNSNVMELENGLLKFKLENNVNYLQLIRKESQGLIYEIGNLRLEIHRLTQQILNPGSSFPGASDNPDFVMQLQAELMAQQNRADETLNWYKKEYEVLPMWYKRFGQLIRVIMGKRTVKSLFKKKYFDDQGRKSTL